MLLHTRYLSYIEHFRASNIASCPCCPDNINDCSENTAGAGTFSVLSEILSPGKLIEEINRVSASWGRSERVERDDGSDCSAENVDVR